MKRLYFLATALLVTMVANSCVEEYLSDNVQQESGVPVKFDLSSREMLKVAVSDAGAVTWVVGDAIKIWDGFHAKVVVLTENDITNEGMNATISTTVTPEATDFVAVYPATAAEDFTAGGVVLNYPAQANGMNGQLIAVASTTAEVKKFSFKTFSSMVRFTTANTYATYASLESIDGAALASKATVSSSDVTDFTISEENEVNKVNINLNGAGTYYFGLRPGVELNGFKVSVYGASNNLIGTASSGKQMAIAQGSVLDLGNIDGISSVNGGNVIFYESFDQCVGGGGNDGEWGADTQKIASKTIKTDNDGWLFYKPYAGDRCMRFCNSSEEGVAVTPALGITSDIVTLKFRVACFDAAKDAKTTLKLAVAGEGTVTTSLPVDEGVINDDLIKPGEGNLFANSFIKGNRKWIEYSVSITGANEETRIMFYPSAGNKTEGGRFWLDEVLVLEGGDEYAYIANQYAPSFAVGTPTNIGGLDWTFVSSGKGSVSNDVYRGYYFHGLATGTKFEDTELQISNYPQPIHSVVVNVKINNKANLTTSVFVEDPETNERTQLGESVTKTSLQTGEDIEFKPSSPVSGKIIIEMTDADGGYGIGGVRIN